MLLPLNPHACIPPGQVEERGGREERVAGVMLPLKAPLFPSPRSRLAIGGVGPRVTHLPLPVPRPHLAGCR